MDLTEHAAEILTRKPEQSLAASVSPSRSEAYAVAITLRNLHRADICLNG